MKSKEKQEAWSGRKKRREESGGDRVKKEIEKLKGEKRDKRHTQEPNQTES